VIRIGADGRGATIEEPQIVKLLPGDESPLSREAAAGEAAAGEPYGVSELRALRAGRNRWD
jgi:hypothetical protein